MTSNEQQILNIQILIFFHKNECVVFKKSKHLPLFFLGSTCIDLVMRQSWNFEFIVIFLRLLFTGKVNFLLV
jgi:hypothetical protein